MVRLNEALIDPDDRHDFDVWCAVRRYMRRCFMCGRLPDKQLVIDTLASKRELPQCGSLGCFWDEEHVH